MTSGSVPSRAPRVTRSASWSSPIACSPTLTPVRRVKVAKSRRAAATRSGSVSAIHTSIGEPFVAVLDLVGLWPPPPQPATTAQSSSTTRARKADKARPYPLARGALAAAGGAAVRERAARDRHELPVVARRAETQAEEAERGVGAELAARRRRGERQLVVAARPGDDLPHPPGRFDGAGG